MNTIVTVFSICTGNIALGHCTDLASLVRDLEQYSPAQIKNSYALLSFTSDTLKMEAN